MTPIDRDYDTPDSIADQLSWLADAGLRPAIAWARRDLAVIVGEAPDAAWRAARMEGSHGQRVVEPCE